MRSERFRPAAIILAGGRSQRFGAPKVLQSFRSVPFVTRLANQLQKQQVAPMVLVLGHQAQAILTQIPQRHRFTIVENKEYPLGQFRSLQVGISQLPATVTGVVMCLVDQPHVSEATFHTLLQTAERHSNSIVIPRFDGKKGHPVFIPAKIFKKILEADARQTHLRDIFRAHSKQVVTVEVDDPAVLEDIDTPQKLAELEVKYPHL